MKNLVISVLLLFTYQVISAQNEYKTDMKNSPDSQIEIQVGFLRGYHLFGHIQVH